MRLIDADAIVVPRDFRIEHFHDRIDEHVAYDLGRSVKKLIDAQPTVDAVEVVRCKDCKFNYANQIPSENACQLYVELPISDEFYCAYGEKEEDEID